LENLPETEVIKILAFTANRVLFEGTRIQAALLEKVIDQLETMESKYLNQFWLEMSKINKGLTIFYRKNLRRDRFTESIVKLAQYLARDPEQLTQNGFSVEDPLQLAADLLGPSSDFSSTSLPNPESVRE
jgi:hypothetical protein